MKLLVISSAPLIYKSDGIYAYSPYVKEMEIWSKQVDEIAFSCPIWDEEGSLLISKIPFPIDKVYPLKEFNFTTFYQAIRAVPLLFMVCFALFKQIKQADAIHLRCPGNIALLACLVQLFFPSKKKSAKYAGNWDAKSKQPLSYRIQKWLLSSAVFTRNMKVLVYGQWENQSQNIVPFFTASYTESEKEPLAPLQLENTIRFIFVGMLTKGKQPLYAIQLVEQLQKSFDVELIFYGDGPEREVLENYIETKSLAAVVTLQGNIDRQLMKEKYKESHFLLLPSKSEGWPKVVAEAMFWGCFPIATSVSCVTTMLDHGKRGLILSGNLADDVAQISNQMTNSEEYRSKVVKAIEWSRNYTIDAFETEIKNVLTT
jgi:glycosyltransferase involved in cell wall biosynthesis